jgi:hypothetical protein
MMWRLACILPFQAPRRIIGRAVSGARTIRKNGRITDFKVGTLT